MWCKLRLGSLLCIVFSLVTVQCTRTPSNSMPDQVVTTPHYGLVFYSERGSTNSIGRNGFGGLYLADLWTKEEKYLTRGSIISQTDHFSWSNATRKLIYTERGVDPFNENQMELISLELNGDRIPLTENNFSDYNGHWSPNGQKIAFWSNRPENSWLYLMDPDGSTIRPVFESNPEFLFGFETDWSPDSERLAVSAVYSYTPPIDLNNVQDNLLLIKLNPKITLSLLSNDRVRSYFSWSRDSSKLVYLSDRIKLDAFQEIYTRMYVLDIQSQKETLIGEFGVIGTPHWSPTKDVIAFSASENMNNNELNVYLINADGTGLKQLTKDGFYRVSSWSPDGKTLALEFIGEQLNEYEIFILDVQSGVLEQVTNNNVFDASPIWVEL